MRKLSFEALSKLSKSQKNMNELTDRFERTKNAISLSLLTNSFPKSYINTRSDKTTYSSGHYLNVIKKSHTLSDMCQ